ncbi:tyrosine-type recombinase/integrase [Actinomadura geliboluensis]|uniref:tyrosine-type recombinase/integrase n=1 Tax=Actinomadura geliboluensis TaxID=882440 RepID=UPI0036B6DA3C
MTHEPQQPEPGDQAGAGLPGAVLLPAAASPPANPREQQFSQVDQEGAGAAADLDLVLGAPLDPLPPARNPYLVYRAALTNPHSRRTIIGCLDRIAALLADRTGHEPTSGESFPWHLLRYEHTVAIRSLITEQEWSPAYARKHLSALRKVLRYAWKLGMMPADDYQRAIDLEPIRGSRLPAGRSLAEAELAALLRVCAEDPGPAGVRDAALIATLYTTGARRSELANARVEHYDPGDRSLILIGKGDKQRRVYVQEQAAVLLGRWLALTDRSEGPLFLRIDRWGNIRSEGLSDDAIRDRLQVRRVAAGLPKLNPHDLRRTFIGDLLDQGADLSTAQKLAGHASPVTTTLYDRRPDRRRKAAVDRLSLPPLQQSQN